MKKVLVCIAACILIVSCDTSSIHVSGPLEIDHAPKVGEEAELTLTVSDNRLSPQIADEGHKIRYKTWIEVTWINTEGSYLESKEKIDVPSDRVLIGNGLQWEGMIGNKDEVQLQEQIVFPDEGIWEVIGYAEVDDIQTIVLGKFKINVTDDKSAIYTKETHDSPEFKWMYNTAPHRGSQPDVPIAVPTVEYPFEHPIVVKFDMSSAPLIGESAELQWTIYAAKDFKNVKVSIEVAKYADPSMRQTVFDLEDIIVTGDLSWEGSIKADTPFPNSAIIKLPEGGDWQIMLKCEDIASDFSTFAYIFLNTSEGKWGWVDSHESQPHNSTPPPVEPQFPPDS